MNPGDDAIEAAASSLQAVATHCDSDLRRDTFVTTLTRYCRKDLPELDWTPDLADEIVARALGARLPASPVTENGMRYEPTPARTAIQLVSRLELEGTDVVVDIGAGRGLFLALLHILSACTVIGVESDAALCAEAANTLSWVAPTTSHILCRDATAITIPRGTVYFLFNPFADLESLEEVYRSIVTTTAASASGTARVVSLGSCSSFFKSRAQFREPFRNGTSLTHLWGGGNLYKTAQCFSVSAL